jgi:hypothetical protein
VSTSLVSSTDFKKFFGGQCLIDETPRGREIVRGEISSVSFNQETRVVKVWFAWIAKLVEGEWVSHDKLVYERQIKTSGSGFHQTPETLCFSTAAGQIEFSVSKTKNMLDPSRVRGQRIKIQETA